MPLRDAVADDGRELGLGLRLETSKDRRGVLAAVGVGPWQTAQRDWNDGASIGRLRARRVRAARQEMRVAAEESHSCYGFSDAA